jgi:FtsH-binding integral membrane protein
VLDYLSGYCWKDILFNSYSNFFFDIIVNMNYDPTNAGGGFNLGGMGSSNPAKVQGFVTRVFNWMFLGLAASGVSAFIFASNPVFMQALYKTPFLHIGLGIALIGMVWYLSANLTKMSFQSAAITFFIYALLNGVFLSSIFIIYTASSIFTTFLVSAATFGAMALYGYTTKKDLTGLGSMMFMALIGLIIASVVNIFLKSSMMSTIISYAGVLIFVGLTAYDMQKIKQIGESANYHPNYAISGALRLYLDFINLFLHLLRIMGNRRN